MTSEPARDDGRARLRARAVLAFGAATLATAETAAGASATCPLRAALVVPLAVGDPAAAEVAVPLVVAGGVGFVLDALDGTVARATGWATPFGARLDLELDAITMVVLSALAWQLGGAGAWLLAAGALRYAFVLAVLGLAGSFGADVAWLFARRSGR